MSQNYRPFNWTDFGVGLCVLPIQLLIFVVASPYLLWKLAQIVAAYTEALGREMRSVARGN